MSHQTMTLEKNDTIDGIPLVHWTWPDNDDESYCGLDMSGEPWEDEDTQVNCPSCIEIDEMCRMWDENV